MKASGGMDDLSFDRHMGIEWDFLLGLQHFHQVF